MCHQSDDVFPDLSANAYSNGSYFWALNESRVHIIYVIVSKFHHDEFFLFTFQMSTFDMCLALLSAGC